MERRYPWALQSHFLASAFRAAAYQPGMLEEVIDGPEFYFPYLQSGDVNSPYTPQVVVMNARGGPMRNPLVQLCHQKQQCGIMVCRGLWSQLTWVEIRSANPEMYALEQVAYLLCAPVSSSVKH